MDVIDHVESVGAYVPRFAITAETFTESFGVFHARGVDEKRVPAGDEDSVTMAVAAARKALANSSANRDDVAGLTFGSTTPPVDEGDVAARIAEILGLNHGVEVSTHTQSTRAGTRAFIAGSRMPGGPVLAVAADTPMGRPDDNIDHKAGAGAVAFVLADEGSATIAETATYSREFSGTRFRERGSEAVNTYDATAYERDAYSSVIAGAVNQLESVGDVLAPTAPDASMPYRATGGVKADVDVAQATSDLGDTGAVSPLFGLLSAWQDGANAVTVVGYGGGASADALTLTGNFDTSWDRETVYVTYAEYARKRGHVITNDGGVN